MAIHVIGDLHGCLSPLQRLLDRIRFDPGRDRLWFVGDLINRGPKSLQTLRFVKSLGKSATCVLGNHDLHLLAVAHGIRKASPKDTLDGILRAPDRDALLDWLRHRPLLHHDVSLNTTMVHAGIHPAWSLRQAAELAREAEAALRSDKYVRFLHRMYGNLPDRWSEQLDKHDRRRFVINVFTRMRYCHRDGTLDFSYNGAPSTAPAHLRPWYALGKPRRKPARIVFGHWSSHPAMSPPWVLPVDRGYVWGGSLVASHLKARRSISVQSASQRAVSPSCSS